jgi:hypothetical protein
MMGLVVRGLCIVSVQTLEFYHGSFLENSVHNAAMYGFSLLFFDNSSQWTYYLQLSSSLYGNQKNCVV